MKVTDMMERYGNHNICINIYIYNIYLPNVHVQMSNLQVNQIMGELDENGDGEIDFEEFMAMMSNQAGVFQSERHMASEVVVVGSLQKKMMDQGD